MNRHLSMYYMCLRDMLVIYQRKGPFLVEAFFKDPVLNKFRRGIISP